MSSSEIASAPPPFFLPLLFPMWVLSVPTFFFPGSPYVSPWPILCGARTRGEQPRDGIFPIAKGVHPLLDDFVIHFNAVVPRSFERAPADSSPVLRLRLFGWRLNSASRAVGFFDVFPHVSSQELDVVRAPNASLSPLIRRPDRSFFRSYPGPAISLRGFFPTSPARCPLNFKATPGLASVNFLFSSFPPHPRFFFFDFSLSIRDHPPLWLLAQLR